MRIGISGNRRVRVRSARGFTVVELCIVLVIAGLILGGIVRGIQLVKQSLLRCETDQLFSLFVSCRIYYEKNGHLPGDWDGNGRFDNNSRVWDDLESKGLANRTRRSPHGNTYNFGYGNVQGRSDNYVRINIPGVVGAYVDKALDDGAYRTGNVRSSGSYTSAGNKNVALFIPVD